MHKSEKANPEPSPTVVLTIGHSTRPIEEFIQLLQAHGVTRVVDVRTVPRSRHNPQYNRDTLPDSLKAAGIGYLHMPELGGLRHAKSDSMNTGWRNANFRGYADYMQTPEFQAAVDKLIQHAQKDRLALMCAEAVPWRCHRSLVEDALLARGIAGEDIMSLTRRQPHKLTPFAKVDGTRVTYPAYNDTKAIPKNKSGKRSVQRVKESLQTAELRDKQASPAPTPKKRKLNRKRASVASEGTPQVKKKTRKPRGE